MSNPKVRPVGELSDHDGLNVIVGVDYDTVTIHTGIFRPGGGIRLTAGQAAAFIRLFTRAYREAGAQSEEPPVSQEAECYRCEKPITGTPVTAPDDPLRRTWCSGECLDSSAESSYEQRYRPGVAT